MNFQSAVGFSITARCPIACAHCIVKAGRHRDEEMPPGAMALWLEACAQLGQHQIDSIIVTGGEPFYAPALLKSILTRAHELGFICVVVTNAYWATSRDAALETLRRFPEIDGLTLSTDQYHRKFIGIGNIKHAADAARERSIAVTAAVCVEDERQLGEAVGALDGIVGPEQVRPAPTLPAGRGARITRLAASSVEGGFLDGPCSGAESPVIFPDGRVIGCMGIVEGLQEHHPLSLGNAVERPLTSILAAAEHNVFLHAMRASGPHSILGRVGHAEAVRRKLDGFRAFGRCAFCYAMAADTWLLDRVVEAVADPELVERTAYARLYFLGEQEMAARLSGMGHIETGTHDG